MTKEEIYEHLANVYLGKSIVSEKKNKPKFDRQILARNIALSVLVAVGAFYGLTAFLVRQHNRLQNNIIFALNNSPIRVKYDLTDPFPKIKQFSIQVPDIDASRYRMLTFSMRGTEEGHPGIVKITVRNRRNETASFFAQGIRQDWKEFRVPLSEFQEITDWGSLEEVSFILEEWNVEKKKGFLLIDNVSFSS